MAHSGVPAHLQTDRERRGQVSLENTLKGFALTSKQNQLPKSIVMLKKEERNSFRVWERHKRKSLFCKREAAVVRRLLMMVVWLTHAEHNNGDDNSGSSNSDGSSSGLSVRRLYLPRFNTRPISGSDKLSRGKNVAKSWQIIKGCGHFSQEQNQKLAYIFMSGEKGWGGLGWVGSLLY